MTSKLKICVLFAMVIAATQAHGQQSDDDLTAIDDTPHITIIGTAHADVAPDLATITLGVKTERVKPAEASAETARLAKAVIDAAKAQGVEARDIGTETVTLTQVFDDLRDGDGRITGRRPRGFEAGETLTMRVRALDKAGVLAESLIEAGATEFDGISFSLENAGPIQDKLVADAVRDAQRKAGLAAAALGVKLGRVLLIERPEAGARPQALGAFKAAAMPAPAAIPVEAGTQTLRSEMEVTWALEP